MTTKLVWFGYTANSSGDPVPFILYDDPASNDYADKRTEYIVRPFVIELPIETDAVGLLQKLAAANPPPSKMAVAIDAHNQTTIDKLKTGETKLPVPTQEERLAIKLEQAVTVISRLCEGYTMDSEETVRVIAYIKDHNRFSDVLTVRFNDPETGF